MTIEFKLPEVSEGVEAADIAEIHVSEGDVIEAGQMVMEVETDKAAADIECPYAGKVTKIHVAQGDSVPIGAVLLTIDETVSAGQPAGEAPTPAPAAEPAPAPPETPAPKPPAATREEVSQARQAVQTKLATAPEAQPARTVGRPTEANGEEAPPPPAGPATRRLARELGVDLRLVAGTGAGGRITAEDVQAYVRTLTSGAQPVAAGGAAMTAPALPDFSQWGPTERQPLNKIARSAAANLSTSWQVIPHVTQHDLVDITELEAARRQFSQTVGKSGPKVTMTAIMIKAAVSALKAFPHFNASLDPQTNELVLKQYYHIGVAVDTPNGLLVPVIRDADQKTILTIAAELTDLAERARNRKLDLKEMQGAAFTITNLGGIGGTGFTPIVNYPEVAILGMSRSRTELRLVEGCPSERLMLPLSLSYDHRVINGADAARFVVRLAGGLSDMFRLLVDC